MKMSAVIGLILSVVLVVALLMLHDRRRSVLTGTWVADIDGWVNNTTIVKPDGSYTCIMRGVSNEVIQLQAGRIDVRVGLYINTASNFTVGTQTFTLHGSNAISLAKILRMDDHTLVIQSPVYSNSVTFIKR